MASADAPRAIVITGSPGTGKSCVSTLLADMLHAPRIDAAKLAFEHGLVLSYEPARDTHEVDVEGLRRLVTSLVIQHDTAVVDTLIPDVVEPHLIRLVVVLRTDPLELARRLMKRRWRPSKILENVEAELLGIVLSEAISYYGESKVCSIDTTNREPREVAELIARVLSGSLPPPSPYSVDWLSKYTDPLQLMEEVRRLISS